MKKNYIISIFILSISLFLPSFAFSNNELAGKQYLEQTSKAFTQIAKKTMPSVVFIKAEYSQNSSSEGNENYFDYFSDEFFRRFFGHPNRPNRKKAEPQVSGGSGFIVSEDGYILTNLHVIKDADKITIILNNGDEYEAKVIGTDSRTDLAVVKIDEKKTFPFLNFGNSNDLDIGEWVVAIGNPFALQSSLTVGVVSAKKRQNLRITDSDDFIQTDAAINPGNSGGPLLNLNAEVIGVNTAMISRTGGYNGIGLAIPSHMAKHVMEQIIKTGSVKRGYIGVYLQEVDKEIAEAFNLDTTNGVLIAEITKDSPAAKAGLKQGDIIISYNNTPVKSMNNFRNKISLLKPDTKIALKVLRNGKEKSFKLKLEASPDEKIETKESSKLGIEVTEIKNMSSEDLKKYRYNTKTEGLFISSVKRNSLASKAGLKKGMLILQINQKKTKTASDFYDAIKETEKRKQILLLIRYQSVTRFLTIRLK
jgi:serine protease Do